MKTSKLNKAHPAVSHLEKKRMFCSIDYVLMLLKQVFLTTGREPSLTVIY